MNITLVAGARPNFMKIAPIIKAIKCKQADGINIHYRLVHTGQHFDKNMSGDFFEQLVIPAPDINLECGGGSQADQTAAIMVKFEKELLQNLPTLVLVVGDVTSTMACAITAKKLCIDVVHVEAGIRSFDMTMPEEINRIVTDSICDHFFTTSELANSQLHQNGINDSRIHFVGNTMIDTLYQNLEKLRKPGLWDENNLTIKKYFLITLHRPSNVDDPKNLSKIIDIILAETGEARRIMVNNCIEDLLGYDAPSKDKPYKAYNFIQEQWGADFNSLPQNWREIFLNLHSPYLDHLR